jgi:hypothetical protein
MIKLKPQIIKLPWAIAHHIQGGFRLGVGAQKWVGVEESTPLIGREARTRLFKFTP